MGAGSSHRIKTYPGAAQGRRMGLETGIAHRYKPQFLLWHKGTLTKGSGTTDSGGKVGLTRKKGQEVGCGKPAEQPTPASPTLLNFDQLLPVITETKKKTSAEPRPTGSSSSKK